jgi:hypothetical protein
VVVMMMMIVAAVVADLADPHDDHLALTAMFLIAITRDAPSFTVSPLPTDGG